MEHDKNEDVDVAKLSDVEKTSDNYLNELQAKIQDLRQKLMEEKIVNGHLQEIKCGLQGRISVLCQRSDELEATNLEEMMGQAELELQNAKDESENLSSEIFGACTEMTQDVQNETARLESMRIQFRGFTDAYIEDENARCDQKIKEVLSVDEEIQAVDNSDEELLKSMQNLGDFDAALQHNFEHLELADEEITDLSLKLHGHGTWNR